VVWLASCVDLGTLANQIADEAGTDADGEVDGGLPSEKCPPGQKSCAGGCVPNNLPEYGCAAESCERCSVPFADPVICDEGKCAVGKCQAGHGSCDGDKQNGCESDLAVAATCGSCTSACPVTTPLCSSGQCVKDCEVGTTQCGSQCVDLVVSATNCGACGVVCPPAANAVGACVASACTVKCNNGFGDCDKTLANGCEALKPYYTDADGDGVGGGLKTGEACTAPPGSSLVPGDCLDSNDKVKPGQTAFFFTGHTNAAGKLSYDYDCNGKEENEPKNVGNCGAACKIGDYTQTSRSNPPAVANFYCGSTQTISNCSTSCSTSSASSMGCR